MMVRAPQPPRPLTIVGGTIVNSSVGVNQQAAQNASPPYTPRKPEKPGAGDLYYFPKKQLKWAIASVLAFILGNAGILVTLWRLTIQGPAWGAWLALAGCIVYAGITGVTVYNQFRLANARSLLLNL